LRAEEESAKKLKKSWNKEFTNIQAMTEEIKKEARENLKNLAE